MKTIAKFKEKLGKEKIHINIIVIGYYWPSDLQIGYDQQQQKSHQKLRKSPEMGKGSFKYA
jgi:hypothetical protein